MVATAWNDGPHCEFEPIQLFAGDLTGASYKWYKGDPDGTPAGTLVSTEKNPVFYDLPAGLHEYHLSIEINDCESATTAVTVVEMFDSPEISSISGGGVYCEGSNVTLNAYNSVETNGMITYTWTGPGGFTYTGLADSEGPFTANMINVEMAQSGVYSLSLETAGGSHMLRV